MKSITYYNYGSPDALQWEDIAKPIPREHDVLIRVRAASVNPYDWHFMRGSPYLIRIITGLRKPKLTRLGTDVAGEVEAVGGGVTLFKPGDHVFGTCKGAFAEFACASESEVVLKPDNVSFEQAAAVPIAAFTALQGLRDKGGIQAGQKVLINGAAGGVGTFAVQIARALGAEVTGVCSTGNVEMVRSIGADSVIDYTQEDFTRKGQRYDMLLDCIGNHPLRACGRVLNAEGIYVGVGGRSGRWGMLALKGMLEKIVLSRFGSQKFIGFVAKFCKEDLAALRELIQAGKVTPVIDRCYRLSEVREAIRYLEEGHARGKVVIAVGSPSSL